MARETSIVSNTADARRKGPTPHRRDVDQGDAVTVTDSIEVELQTDGALEMVLNEDGGGDDPSLDQPNGDDLRDCAGLENIAVSVRFLEPGDSVTVRVAVYTVQLDPAKAASKKHTLLGVNKATATAGALRYEGKAVAETLYFQSAGGHAYKVLITKPAKKVDVYAWAF